MEVQPWLFLTAIYAGLSLPFGLAYIQCAVENPEPWMRRVPNGVIVLWGLTVGFLFLPVGAMCLGWQGVRWLAKKPGG